MNAIIKHCLIIILVLPYSLSLAQNSFLLLDKEQNLMYEADMISLSDSFHSSIYPRQIKTLGNYKAIQSSLQIDKKAFGDYLFNRYPIELGKATTRIMPIFNLNLSKDFSDSPSPYTTGGGLLLHSDFGEKFSLEFSVYGAKERFGLEEQKQINRTSILPGIGEYNAQIGDTYSYTNWEGYIAYSPNRFFNLQIGKQKNFFGDGYRSLFLSGNSSSYPFAKAIVNLGKLQYIILYQFLKDVDTEVEIFPNEAKYSTSHLLSWNIGKRLNINLFETVIWRDMLGGDVKRGYDLNYLNPIIFLRPVEFSIGSPDNMIMGGGFRFRLFKNTNFYGQLVLDEFKLKEIMADNGWWANKYGVQMGLKIYDLFGIENLFVLGEYNTIRPYMYSHKNSMTNYGNMYQSLAHPLGANFKEFIALANYRKGRWQFQGKIALSQVGLDTDSLNKGQDIYKPYYLNIDEYGNFTTQGLLTKMVKAEVKVAYLINPLWNLKLETGIRFYSQSNEREEDEQSMIFISLKTMF